MNILLGIHNRNFSCFSKVNGCNWFIVELDIYSFPSVLDSVIVDHAYID